MSADYDHVAWVYPSGPDEIAVAVDIDGLVVGAVHGDTTGSPDRMPQWLAGQALGRQQVGESDVLFSGHFHTLRVQDLGGGRTWIMCPAMDNGSPFYRHKRGTDSVPGLLSVELTSGSAPGWRGLVLHTGD